MRTWRSVLGLRSRVQPLAARRKEWAYATVEVFGAVSPLTVQAYRMALKDQDIRDAKLVAIRCLQTRRASDGAPAPWSTLADGIAFM